AHAVAQQRADRIATLLQSWGAGPPPTPRPAGPAPPFFIQEVVARCAAVSSVRASPPSVTRMCATR
ncbi:hypothetical protein, partial [Pseudomonas aeruginosa]|uniref:hypothetical protein n=1 Tax=Pseudomonas aeruginosa TaxID=287 RepID=UPI003F4A3068